MKAAIEMLGTSRASLYRWIHAGTFPAPVKIGERAIAFKLSELEKWIEIQRKWFGKEIVLTVCDFDEIIARYSAIKPR